MIDPIDWTYINGKNQRLLMIYAGRDVVSFSLVLRVFDEDDWNHIKTIAPDRPEHEESYAGAYEWSGQGAERTLNARADGVLLQFDENDAPILLEVKKMTIRYGRFSSMISKEEHRGLHMKSFPLALYEPVDVFFPEGQAHSYCFTLDPPEGVPDNQLDLVLEGCGNLDVFRDADGFPNDPGRAIASIGGTGPCFKELNNAFGENNRRLGLRLWNDGSKGGFARLYVGRPIDRIRLKLDFMGERSDYADSDGAFKQRLSELVTTANYYLYQATCGRVRVTDCEVRFRTLPPPPDELPDGVVGEERLESSRTTNTWPRVMRLPMSWWNAPASDINRSGGELAHEILHCRYDLNDEYAEVPPLSGNQVVVCPGTLMSSPLADELCWSRNHVKSRLEAPLYYMRDSCWTILAGKLGMPEPDGAPGHVFSKRPDSLQILPVSISIIQVDSPGDVISDVVGDIEEAVNKLKPK